MSLFHFHRTAEHGHLHGTVVEALDPRVKLVSAVALAVWVSLVPPAAAGILAVLAVGLVILGALAQIPPATLLLRASAAVPFVVVPGLMRVVEGTFDARTLAIMAGRGYTAAMIATLLVSVTPFPSLLAGASALGIPDVLVQTTALAYRYLAVLRDRGAAMTASARARGYGPSTPARFTVAGNLLGSLLIRSLHRAERVHVAMLARGYTGRFPPSRPLRMRLVDWAAGAVVVGGVIGSLAWMR